MCSPYSLRFCPCHFTFEGYKGPTVPCSFKILVTASNPGRSLSCSYVKSPSLHG